MTPLQIATLGIRLVGLVWTVIAISSAHRWIPFIASADPGQIDRASFVFLAGLQLATCAVLLLFPATIATMLLPSLRSTKAAVPTHAVEWQTLAVIAVGLWILTRAVPDAFYWVAYYLAAHRAGVEYDTSDPQYIAGVVSTIVEVGLGLWLTIGGKGLATVLFKLRTSGIRQ